MLFVVSSLWLGPNTKKKSEVSPFINLKVPIKVENELVRKSITYKEVCDANWNTNKELWKELALLR